MPFWEWAERPIVLCTDMAAGWMGLAVAVSTGMWWPSKGRAQPGYEAPRWPWRLWLEKSAILGRAGVVEVAGVLEVLAAEEEITEEEEVAEEVSWWFTSSNIFPQLRLILLLLDCDELVCDVAGADELSLSGPLLSLSLEGPGEPLSPWLLLLLDDDIGTRAGRSLALFSSRGEPLSLLTDSLPADLSSAGEEVLGGESIFPLCCSFFFSSFFSKGGMMFFPGFVSLPILLHVCARRARGLFFASNVVGNG